MAEINVKSPQLKDRDVSTYSFLAKVSLGTTAGPCCAAICAIDIPGLTVAGTATGFTISGFEVEADLALDEDRDAAIQFLSLGAVGSAEESDIWILNATVGADPCSDGSRVVTVDVNIAAAAALDLTSDSITDGQILVHLPIKAKDFTV